MTKPRRSWGYAAAALPDGAARLQWLASTHGYQPNAECLLRALAAPGGSVETVRWLLSEEVEGRTSGGLSKIAACAGLEKLRLLREGGRLRHPGAALLYALRAGDAHAASAAWLLELCRSHPDGQFELTARHLASAARSGSVRLLAWLREEGCPMGAWAWDRLDRAVETRQRVGVVASGCEAALEWLAEAGCPMPTNGMPYVTAACSGDMRTLEVLRRVGMPLGPQNGIAFKAAIGGRAREAAAPLPVLQWLVEAGMPVRWDKASEESRLYRSGPEREEVRAWLKEQRAAARQRGEAVSMKEEAEEEEYKKCEFGFLCRRIYEEKGWEDEFDSDMGDVDDKHWDDDVDESDDGDGDDDEEGGQGAPEGDAQEQA
ncbi:hypothetical protein HYH03_010693 [Edaphochlamys debaryana]|uniref:Ankyrin repeat protein n=1 Tax=Edaphochlamys debaryana TaxID=47281 RepID=A0A836BVU0_9CHLO|nr:hypothetical protein HYH03_010693 [Edaphochlamys debaryana]|eukprot:KAG2491021.1 hypothetical protein HYH03_010693 [Edaphochlamys debaryana]